MMLCTEVKTVVIPITDQKCFQVPAGSYHPEVAYRVVHVMPTQVQSQLSMKPQQMLIIIMEREIPMPGQAKSDAAAS
jgi:hypothetical protein